MRETKQIAITTCIILLFISHANIGNANTLPIIKPVNKEKNITIENQKILDQIYYNQSKKKNKKKQVTSISKMQLSEKSIQDYDVVTSENSFYLEIKKPSKIAKKRYKLHKEAYNTMLSDQYELAITLYNNLLKKYPNDELSLSSIALSYHKLGDIKSAKKFYAKTIKLYPNNFNTINNYLILVSQEYPKEAINELLKLNQVFNKNHLLKAQISYLYSKEQKYNLALKYINQALKISNKNPNYLYNKAIILEYLGNKKEAQEIYSYIINTESNSKNIPVALLKQKLESL